MLGYRAKVIRDTASDESGIILIEGTVEGRFYLRPKDGEMERIPTKPFDLVSGNRMMWRFSGYDSQEIFQSISDALYEAGFTPTDFKGEGEVQAIRDHLSDLQSMLGVRDKADISLTRKVNRCQPNKGGSVPGATRYTLRGYRAANATRSRTGPSYSTRRFHRRVSYTPRTTQGLAASTLPGTAGAE